MERQLYDVLSGASYTVSSGAVQVTLAGADRCAAGARSHSQQLAQCSDRVDHPQPRAERQRLDQFLP